MGRWNPDARGRLEQAAYELFLEHGYERTTVAEIAARADLTERTFFRHFADKREVLFGGTVALETAMRKALEAADARLTPMVAVRPAVLAAAAMLHGRHDHARERQQLVDAHRDLRERSLVKRATLVATLAKALELRGTPVLAARLAAEVGMAVFYLAFEQWIAGPQDREFAEYIDEGFTAVAGTIA